MIKTYRNKWPKSLRPGCLCFAGGFTIVELLVVIVISSVLAISVVAMFVTQTRTLSLNEDLVDMEQNLRIAMDMIHRDVRMAGAYLDKDNMPAFKLGTIYYNSAANVMVPINSDGGPGPPPTPDAIQLRYSTQPGVGIMSYSGGAGGGAANFHVCHPSGLSDGQKIEISYKAEDAGGNPYAVNGVIVITSLNEDKPCPGTVVPCPGSCDKANFSPGPSVWNPPGGLIDYDSSGNLWNDIETITYFITSDSNSDGVDDDPALMRVLNRGTPAIVSFGVTDLQIDYLDENDASTTVLADIRKVRIEVSGKTRHEHNIGGSGKRDRTLTTEVLVRNLQY